MNLFERVMMPKPKQSWFDMTHDRKYSLDMGFLVPNGLAETMPGDLWTLSAENLFRLAPLVSPVMHRITIDTHYFFCPIRLVFPQWEDYNLEQSPIEHPWIDRLDSIESGDLGDYLGYPTANSSLSELRANPIPIAMYALIFDEWYRDQNLANEQFEVLPGGEAPVSVTNLMNSAPLPRAYRHDYFTSCLPTPSKGVDVRIPAFLTGDGVVEPTEDGTQPQWNITSNDNLAAGAVTGQAITGDVQVGGNDAYYDPNGHLVIPSSQVGYIRDLRRAFKLQEWYEKRSRGGSRLVEINQSHFGVRNPDARLNRPELIGGFRQNMVISEVLSTAQTIDQSSNDIPVGELAGHGISYGGGNKFKYYCHERGFIF